MYRLHVEHSCDIECGSTAIMATLPCQNNFCSLQCLVSMQLQLIWLVVLSYNYCQPLQHIQRSVKRRLCHVAKTEIWRSSRNSVSEQNSHKVRYLSDNLNLHYLSQRGRFYSMHICYIFARHPCIMIFTALTLYQQSCTFWKPTVPHVWTFLH